MSHAQSRQGVLAAAGRARHVAALCLACLIAASCSLPFDPADTPTDMLGLYQTWAKAQFGDAKSQFDLGVFYLFQAVKPDFAASRLWLQKAADQNNAEAQFTLGWIHHDGIGVGKDEQQAFFWLQKAAALGHRKAAKQLADMYFHGIGAKRNVIEAERLYRSVALPTDDEVQFALGMIYADKDSPLANAALALQWFEKAAANGSAEAKLQAGLLYVGNPQMQDFAKALGLLREAAEAGSVEAIFQLGEMHYYGKGARRDVVAAANWYTKAAEQKHEASEYMVGKIYTEIKNYRDAAPWLEKAAARDDPAALYLLGRLYASGEGVGKEPRKASELLLRAHAYGNPSAQALLADLLSQPGAAGQNFPLAYYFAFLAYANPDLPREDRVETGKRVGVLEKYLSPDIVTKAQAEARKFKPLARSEARPEGTIAQGRTVGSGTGFIVSKEGHVLTNRHVAALGTSYRTRIDGLPRTLTLVAIDEKNDLAVLKLPNPVEFVLPFRVGKPIRPGDDVVALGFPLHGSRMVSSDVKVTTGTLTALAGPNDDPTLEQITAPIQPGNSGGPLLDLSGNVVGVVVAKIDAWAVAQRTGKILENINFAIKSTVARDFLESKGVRVATAPSEQDRKAADVGEMAKRATLFIEVSR